MEISSRSENQTSKTMSNSLQRTSFLRHSILVIFIALIAGWCNASLASNKPWCASDGGDWNCVPFEYGAWIYQAYYSSYFSAGGGFSTPTSAYSALASLTANRMSEAKCTYTLSTLSPFTSCSIYIDTCQYATVNLSYGGSDCGYGIASTNGYVTGSRKRWCPQGTQRIYWGYYEGDYCVATTSYQIEIQGNSNSTEPWNKNTS